MSIKSIPPELVITSSVSSGSVAPATAKGDAKASSNDSFQAILADVSADTAGTSQQGSTPPAPVHISLGGIEHHNPTVSQVGDTLKNDPVFLGRIDERTPTVSHLLVDNPEYADRTYQLIFAEQNRDKRFTEMSPGTEVFLLPQTGEIVWQGDGPRQVSHTGATDNLPKGDGQISAGPARDLVEGVSAFLGADYSEINCFELLVKGLERMGIPYGGKNGLYRALTEMARENGVPENAYLNGEGVTRVAGSVVLERSFLPAADWRRQAGEFFAEMKNSLAQGRILSFSLQSQGHTGVVSKQDEQWTFINSGQLDNPVTSGSGSRGVGEEHLEREVHNWFRRAHHKGESLVITLGEVKPERIIAQLNQGLSTYGDNSGNTAV